MLFDAFLEPREGEDDGIPLPNYRLDSPLECNVDTVAHVRATRD
jgi:hypothetical protein